jgi:hypothetical protein
MQPSCVSLVRSPPAPPVSAAGCARCFPKAAADLLSRQVQALGPKHPNRCGALWLSEHFVSFVLRAFAQIPL